MKFTPIEKAAADLLVLTLVTSIEEVGRQS